MKRSGREGGPPKNVKELLVEMKDTSELMIDLAYSALIFDSQEMAQEVRVQEELMDELMYMIRMRTIMAGARNEDEAEQLAGLLQVAKAAEQISNAAADIAGLLDMDYSSRPFLSFVLREGDERSALARVLTGSDLADRRLDEAEVESKSGVKVIAVRRRNRWLWGPEGDFRVRDGDVLVLRGHDFDEFERRFMKGAKVFG